jgi:ABC-type Mn2+/Zn2+ transport system permease subunit
MLEIFKEPFMQTALLGGLIIGSLCAYLGVFVILKRIVFLGIACSQAAALGVALGLFIGINPILTASVLTFLAILLLWFPLTEKTISRESLIGFTYCTSAALAVILIAKNPLAEAQGLNLISGNLLYITWQDILLLGVISLAIAVIHLFFFKEFIFVSFDRETAFTTGIRADIKDLLLYSTIGSAISISIKICGVIFVFASLVIPAMAGLLLAKEIKKIFLASILIASSCLILGLSISYKLDLPTAPLVVGMYGLVFVVLSIIRLIF